MSPDKQQSIAASLKSSLRGIRKLSPRYLRNVLLSAKTFQDLLWTEARSSQMVLCVQTLIVTDMYSNSVTNHYLSLHKSLFNNIFPAGEMSDTKAYPRSQP
jgi:hypothetical protein